MGLPVMNPDGTGCCPPCTPVACAAEVLLQCNQAFHHKIICGFASMDGSQHRYASARMQWTGTSDASDSAGGPLVSDHSEVDMTAFFSANRIADYGVGSPEDNCTTLCEPSLVEGQVTRVAVWSDATPDVDTSNEATCVGTSYTNAFYNLLSYPIIEWLDHAPPNAFFPSVACSTSGDFESTTDPAPSAATYQRSNDDAIDFGGFTRQCTGSESVTYTLLDEITYDELAESLLSEPLPVVTDVSSCPEDAFFTRIDDDRLENLLLGIQAQYRPIAFRAKRVTPATGPIIVFYTVTSYFPDLGTPLSSEDFSVQIHDGDDYSETRYLEPDVYMNAVYPQSLTLIITAVSAFPDC